MCSGACCALIDNRQAVVGLERVDQRVVFGVRREVLFTILQLEIDGIPEAIHVPFMAPCPWAFFSLADA